MNNRLSKDEYGDLLTEFKEAVGESGALIDEHLRNAHDEIEKAIKLSEQYGIPFEFGVGEDANRKYVPQKWSDQFRKLICDFPASVNPDDEYEIGELLGFMAPYDKGPKGGGREYWNTSSLHC